MIIAKGQLKKNNDPNIGDDDSSSLSSRLTSPSPWQTTRNGTVSVYVVNTDLKGWISHENFASTNCGGHIASIHNIQEHELILDLVSHVFGGPTGVWIGARQGSTKSNDPDIKEGRFKWSDKSEPVYLQWAENQPDNQIAQLETGQVIGQHHAFLNADGFVSDERGGVSSGKQAPAVLILPPNYETRELYPSCDVTKLARGY